MSCEICGRNNCCASFHSIEEQQSFDEIADKIKNRAISILAHRIEKLNGHYHGDYFYIKLDEVIKIINDYN